MTRRRAKITREIHNLKVRAGEIGHVRLHVNPSTGCSWWVASAPKSTVVGISVSEEIDPTVDCGNPPRPGCSNLFAVYSFKSHVRGYYRIELRYGHAWAHHEYYIAAIVHLTVTGTRTKKRV